MKKWIKFLSLAGLVFMTVTAQAADKPAVIRVGAVGSSGKPFAGGINGIVQSLGLLQQEFKSDGIQIQLTLYKGAGPAVNEALAAGKLDIASIGDLPCVIGRAGGLKTRYILGRDNGVNSYIIAAPQANIHSLKDLKGKRISVSKGTKTHLTLNRLLAQVGLTERDVKLVNLSGADASAALATGSVDAIIGGADRPLVQQGLAVNVYDTRKDPIQNKGRGALLVTEEFAKKYPDIVKRVVKAHIRAAYWASQEKNREALYAIETKTGGSRQSLIVDLAGQNLKEKYDPTLNASSVASFKDIVDFAFRSRLIRQKFDVDQWFDKSYSEAALKELGLENYWK